MRDKHIKSFKKFNENLDSNFITELDRSREEVIELLSNSSDFDKEELDNMTNNELVELWSSQEMDNWLDELDEEDSEY
jgi:hypothetical protein